MNKRTVVVLFGGQSSEHEISIISATTIILNIDKEEYDILIIGITKEGHWLKVENLEQIQSGEWKNNKITAVISPDVKQKGVLLIHGESIELVKVDVVFPVLHGMFGEDGTIQGLLELSGIPYVGCGVVSSSICMDKLYTKVIVDTLHIRQAKYVPILTKELKEIESIIKKIEEKLFYPVFVKPSNAGSSKGVSKAYNQKELKQALELAAKYDRKILVEETIVGKEIECAVLGGKEAKASGVGEIVAEADFYDYDAKYNSDNSQVIISPDLPEGIEMKIRENALKIFEAVDGYGLARADFFLEEGSNEVIFNEINTMPGFTSISMYPMLWEAKGMNKKQLIGKLIAFAFKRYE